jgi:flagellar basal-body rod protein FlgF
MSDIVSQASSSIGGLNREFNIIAHNLANVSTVGYKRRCNTFSNSLTAQGAGTQAEGGGAVDLESVFDFTQGNIIETGRPLDFALVGRGFFVIETPEGPLYTRNGMFRLDQNGQIVDSAGRIVAGEAGPITIPPSVGLSQVGVASDGSISGGADGVRVPIGKFRLVDFKDDERELLAVGIHCFEAPEDVKPQSPENLIVKQGFEESSNVQLVEELVDMIMVSRLYEANMQFVSVKRDTSKSIIDVAMS